MSPNQPAEMGGKSAGRFSDCQQICQSANLPVDLCNLCHSVNLPGWGGVNLLADLVTVTKSASRSMQCLPVSKSVGGGKSASRFSDCQQICQLPNLLADSPPQFLPAEIPGYFCQF